ncbi:unnamed protein product [Effrenium voratum]|nr:unnamed protein product [Effrenium voratum]
MGPGAEISFLRTLQASDWSVALCLLWSPDRQIALNAIHYTAVIKMCGRKRQWSVGLELLGGLDHKALQPDVVAYNSAANACAKAQQWTCTLRILRILGMDRGLRRDEVTCTAAIEALRLEWPKAIWLLAELPLRRLQVDAVACGAASRTAAWAWAAGLLADLPRRTLEPNGVAYGATAWTWWQSLRTLEAMASKGIEGVQVYNSAISSLEKAARWAEALSLFGSLVCPDLVSHNAVISACASGRRWQSALLVLGHLDDQRLSPDVITFNAAIAACAQHWRAVGALLHAMFSWSLTPTVMTFNAALSGAVRWEQCAALLGQMKVLALQPDDFSYSIALGTDMRWQLALQLGTGANLVVRNAVLSGLKGEWAIAVALLSRDADLLSFSAAASACEKAAWDSALQLLRASRPRALEADLLLHSPVLAACECASQWRRALRLFHRLPARRVEPDGICAASAVGSAAAGTQWWLALAAMTPELRTMSSASKAVAACEGSGQPAMLWQFASSLPSEEGNGKQRSCFSLKRPPCNSMRAEPACVLMVPLMPFFLRPRWRSSEEGNIQHGT